jgi:hypothetical protein
VGEKTSRLRQRLRETGESQVRQLELLLEDKGPLIRGTLGKRRRVCGNKTCHCVTGEKHESTYLSASDGGQTRQVHVPVEHQDRVAAGVARYRRFRLAKAKLAELAQSQLELVDELGRSLLEPYPPEHPLPPPRRIPRRVKGNRETP